MWTQCPNNAAERNGSERQDMKEHRKAVGQCLLPNETDACNDVLASLAKIKLGTVMWETVIHDV